MWSTLLDARTIDALLLAGRRCALSFDAGSGKLTGLPAELALGGADADDARRRCSHAGSRGSTRCSTKATPAQPSWQRNRMEYAFALKAGDTQLDAAEYTDGHLDWDDFRATAAAPVGQTP